MKFKCCCSKEKCARWRHDFCTYVYNKETGEFFARSCFGWLLLVIFLIVFYVTLGAHFYAYMQLYLFWTVGDSPIYRDPRRSLSLRATPSKIDQDIFMMNEATAPIWAAKVGKLFDERDRKANRHKRSNGTKPSRASARAGQDCISQITSNRVPTVFFEYSKLLNYEPKTFASKTDAQEHMGATFGPQAKEFVGLRSFSANRVPLHCFGETELDHQLLGSVSYCAGDGGPTKEELKFTSDKIDPGYLPPVVAVSFPGVIPGMPVSVICALGMADVTSDSDGQIQFHVMKS